MKKKNHRETNLDTIFTLDFDQVLQIFSSPVSVWIGDAKGNDVADKKGMSDEEKCSQEGRKRRPLTQSREGWRRHTTKLERKGSRVAPDSIVGCGLPQDLREREDRGTSVCSAPHLLVHPQIKEV